MRFQFSEKDPAVVKNKIVEAIGGRDLGKLVNFDLNGNQLEVTISKLGTSKLIFSHKNIDAGSEFKLESEKIAFAHRAFQDEIKGKILAVIKNIGGKIMDA